MFIKSATIAALAFVAAVSAQEGTPNHTHFTNPVGEAQVFPAGENSTFSWAFACVAPSTYTSPTPQTVDVQLLNADDPNKAFFLAPVTTIDCSKTSGNEPWTVPVRDDAPGTIYSLKIVLSEPVYSGRFKISSKDAPAPGPAPGAGSGSGSGSDDSTSAAGALAPVLTGVALAASAALLKRKTNDAKTLSRWVSICRRDPRD
ncbi:hypothetical protein BG011_001195 [Mortierella polycephala]|uniref:Uncharacterized protein n=1 Tax=Mortierella polycephala TaxID=41804 RepID=A0A9P6QGL9_9FUNG|nr:hypothetical protein BG011_001195 [Mortierella polycephala]